MDDEILLARVQRLELRTWRLLGATILVGVLTGHITFDVGEPADASQKDEPLSIYMLCESAERIDAVQNRLLFNRTDGVKTYSVEVIGPGVDCQPFSLYDLTIESHFR